MQQLPLGVRIPDRAAFESFYPGRNTQAVSHLQCLARGEATGTAWICGPEGSGKTHLLQAVCVEASRTERAGYFPLAQVRSHGAQILEGQPLDCLSLDDLDAVIGDPEWERALFALFTDFDERGARLAVAAQSPPALLSWNLRDLGSRFGASAVFQLRALDESEQQEALQLRARARGFDLPDETARWMLRRFPRDMRTLYELLDTLDEAALVAQRRRITVPFIRSVLRE